MRNQDLDKEYRRIAHVLEAERKSAEISTLNLKWSLSNLLMAQSVYEEGERKKKEAEESRVPQRVRVIPYLRGVEGPDFIVYESRCLRCNSVEIAGAGTCSNMKCPNSNLTQGVGDRLVTPMSRSVTIMQDSSGGPLLVIRGIRCSGDVNTVVRNAKDELVCVNCAKRLQRVGKANECPTCLKIQPPETLKVLKKKSKK